MPMRCNPAGCALVKSFESCRLTAYQDDNGIWTIGWGHTGPEVVDGLVWTQERADDQFLLDMSQRAERPANAYITPSALAGLSSNQFSAICSLIYNIGSGRFKGSSALHLINAGDLTDVPAHIKLWDEDDGGVSAGLVRRRAAECLLYETPDTVSS